MVFAAVAFGLIVLRHEASAPSDLNDSGLHLSMTKWAATAIRAGHNPFDGWYSYLGLGFPQLRHYQSVPHVLTAIVGIVLGVERTYHWSLYLLLALWPVSVYIGARLLGLGKTTACCAALLSPLATSAPSYGYEMSSYLWRGYGLWPQLWASWLLPISLGLAHQALLAEHPRPRTFILAAGSVALTISIHYLTGWLLLALIAAMPIIDPRLWRPRLTRSLVLIVGSMSLVLWLILPLLLDGAGVTIASVPRGSFFFDSYGATKVLPWLVKGELFDYGRFPVLTPLVAIGAVLTCMRARRNLGSRVVLLLSVSSLVLFFGRSTLGPLLDLIPLGHDMFFHRFIAAFQLGGLFLAGEALAFFFHGAVMLMGRYGPRVLAQAIAVVVVGLVLLPAVNDRAAFASEGAGFMRRQVVDDRVDGADLDQLIAQVNGRVGRVYAGTRSGWGTTYAIGQVPVFAYLLNKDVDALGYFGRLLSIGSIAELTFDETNPAAYAAFGIRWLILPADREPGVAATLLASSGRHRLYSLDAPGWGEVVDATSIVSLTDESLLQAVIPPASSPALRSSDRQLIRWQGQVGVPTAGGAGSPGRIVSAASEPDTGRFVFDVEASRAAYLAVAISWHPRLVATVDGKPTPVVMISPGTAAVAVGAGRHVVNVHYRPFQDTWLVVLLGVVIFSTAVWVSMGSSRGRLLFFDAVRRRRRNHP